MKNFYDALLTDYRQRSTPRDIRFTEKHGVVYALGLARPGNGKYLARVCMQRRRTRADRSRRWECSATRQPSVHGSPRMV